MRPFLAIIALLAAIPAPSRAQKENSKPATPTKSADCRFSDGKIVHIEYSGMRVQGRKIFGGVVPYGQVWRPSSDAVTTLVTDVDLSVGSQEIPAGSYDLSIVPAADRWTLILSKRTDEPGRRDEDLLRTDMEVSKSPSLVEDFTIAFEHKGEGCVLRSSWENTQAWVEVSEKKLCWPTTTPLTYQCSEN